MREYTVTENDAGKRADRFLSRAAPDITPSALQKAFRKKDVKKNGKPCRADDRLAAGDTVRLYLPAVTAAPPEERRCPPLTPGMVFYEDAHLLVLHKPGNLPSQADNGEFGIEDMARAYLRDTKQWSPEKENGFTPSLCHRLDRGTEGLLLFAKTGWALRTLTGLIRDREVIKTYRCVVAGAPARPSGEWRDYLWKDAKQKRVYARKNPSPGAKMALSRYRVLGAANGKSLLEVELITGRTHQIRVQCASRGFPVEGDGKYGKGGGSLALCAVAIEIGSGEVPESWRSFRLDKKFPDFD
ncbi:MAG: RluA family pseudouridine synthase [Oscillospiraceae bacterium]|jgi:23S rRNA pseudouridine955/2504/2580 synthase|nr:RluA family pseudouridine synthase [Oscillospiraceae bacterium]